MYFGRAFHSDLKFSLSRTHISFRYARESSSRMFLKSYYNSVGWSLFIEVTRYETMIWNHKDSNTTNLAKYIWDPQLNKLLM